MKTKMLMPLVPDDKRPARWARQVRKVAVVVLD
jgi:hypothetical protein